MRHLEAKQHCQFTYQYHRKFQFRKQESSPSPFLAWVCWKRKVMPANFKHFNVYWCQWKSADRAHITVGHNGSRIHAGLNCSFASKRKSLLIQNVQRRITSSTFFFSQKQWFSFFRLWLLTPQDRKVEQNGRNWCVVVSLWRARYTYRESSGALRTRETNITLKKEVSLEIEMIKNI